MGKMKLNIQLFAVHTNTTFSEPALTDANITNNNSTLKITIYFDAGNNVTWFESKTLWCNCNGVAQSKKVSLSKGGSVTETYTFDNITHNTDGTKTVNWSWDITTGTSVIGTLERSGSRTLQTIPRASEIDSVTSGTTQYNPQVRWTPKNASFKYKITYSYGSYSFTTPLLSPGTTSQVGYDSHTIPHSIFTNAPNSSTITATAKLTTYQADGTTIIGEKTKTFTITLNSGEKPSVAFNSIAEANTTMQSLNWGVYVQNKSQLSIDLRAYGRWSSTVTSTSTSISGSNYSGTNFTTNALNTSGNITLNSVVNDSRGRSGTASSTISVIAYSNPQITNAVAVRSLQDGTESDEGTYLKYSFSGSISAVSNHNQHLFRIGYRIKDTGSYTYINVNTTDYSINYTNYLLNLNLDTNEMYDIIFEANDTFTSSSIKRQIETGFDLMNFNTSGKALAFGKVSQASSNEELLEIGMETKIDGSLILNNFNNTLVIGDQNTYYTHFNNSLNKPFYFNNKIEANGNITSYGKYYLANGEPIGNRRIGYFTMQNTTTGSWQLCTNTITINLKKGVYLIRYSITLTGGGNGLATLNAAINDVRQGADWRQSIPIGSGLNTTANILVRYEAGSDGDYTFSCYTYNNVNCNGSSGIVELIRLN